MFGLRTPANGVAHAARETFLERLCRENDWPIDLRDGIAIALYFNGDAVTSRRDVIVVHGPGDSVASFSCACRAGFVARDMTTPELALFLARNKESMFGKWQITVEDGIVRAHVRYAALAGGLDAAAFRSICAGLVGEVAYVEAALRSQGIL